MTRERRWIYLVALALVVAVAYFAIDSALEKQSSQDENATLAAMSPGLGSLNIVTLLDGRLAGGASYRISPDPSTGGGNYTIRDGLGIDSSNVAGIITIDGIPDGVYSVVQVGSPGAEPRDIIPRVVTVAGGNSEAVTFGTKASGSAGSEGASNFEGIDSIVYAAKFECGTIRGGEGPLRPGHYDTDIGIFNKQDFPVKATWSAASNDNVATNSILKTLAARTSTGIVCNDIRTLIGGADDFVEGFVVVEIPVDSKILSSISGASSVLDSSSQDRIDILDIQIFYTANALEELPHPVLVDKISFVITSNMTIGSLPDSMIGTVLDVTLASETEMITNPVERVKNHLLQKYNMTAQEILGIRIEIRSVDVGVGTMIDDHAISLSKVRPQVRVS